MSRSGHHNHYISGVVESKGRMSQGYAEQLLVKELAEESRSGSPTLSDVSSDSTKENRQEAPSPKKILDTTSSDDDDDDDMKEMMELQRREEIHDIIKDKSMSKEERKERMAEVRERYAALAEDLGYA